MSDWACGEGETRMERTLGKGTEEHKSSSILQPESTLKGRAKLGVEL